MDAVSLPKTSEKFRFLYDVKSHFMPIRTDAKEAQFRLCCIKRKVLGKKKTPYVMTHDGCTIHCPHSDVKKNYNFKIINLETQESSQDTTLILV